MFGKFFDTSATEAFVRQVVDDLQKSIPPARVDEKSNQIDKRRSQLDMLIRRRADALVSAARLNVYQKAKLSPMLQEALTAAGYPDTFSEPFAYDVMKLVAVASTEVH